MRTERMGPDHELELELDAAPTQIGACEERARQAAADSHRLQGHGAAMGSGGVLL